MKKVEAEKLAKVNPKFKEGYTERMEPEQKVSDTILKLIALAEAGSHLPKQELFESLWYDDGKREAHIERRIGYDHITDQEDYIIKTFEALSSAEIARLGDGGYIEIEMDNQTWSVVIDGNGTIKTAYPHDDRFASFAQNQANRGRKVYETTIPERIREILKRLFGAL
ncbi:MAG: hypothetical protein HQL49_02230 [Gammaproteobacteria bacterium]|nr:hypothetical protein [Gammaproteobacteria bacterium]